MGQPSLRVTAEQVYGIAMGSYGECDPSYEQFSKSEQDLTVPPRPTHRRLLTRQLTSSTSHSNLNTALYGT